MAVTADQIVVEVTALVDGYKQAMVQVANVTINNIKVAEEAAKKGGSSIAKALETAAGRVPDLIRNLAEGQNAVHLFLQEGAALLPIFGGWGVVLGGVVGAIDAVAASTGAFETAAERAAAAQKTFDQAMKDTKGSLTESEQAAVDLASGLSLVEKGLLATAAQEIDDAIRDQKEQLADLLDAARVAGRGVQQALIQKQIDTGLDLTPQEKEIFQMGSMLEKATNLTSAQIDALLARVRELSPSLADVSEKAGGFATALSKSANGAAVLETNVAAGIKVQERITVLHKEGAEAADGAGQAAQNLGLKYGNAAHQILTLAEALQVFNSEATRSRSAAVQAGVDLDKLEQRILAETEAYKKGKAAVDARNDSLAVEKVRSEALAAAQKSGLGDNDAKAEANRIAAEEQARLQAQRTYQENERLRTRAAARQGAAAGTKPDAGAKDPVADLQRQAELNERLLLVYKRGTDAQAAMKAQMEALNSARERGLELGTAEHAQYVQQYEDAAARKHRSDELLADYAKAAQLVDAAMTSQEKYEKDKAEYAKLHRELALTDAEYARVLEKLNLENQGYVEGIQAIGQAIQGGIQGATSFTDALTKVGTALAQMLLQAALFGNGPLGKAFGTLTGLGSGLLGLAFGGGGSIGYDGGTGMGPIGPGGTAGHAAMGGQVLPGRLYEVGETGREWFAPSVPGQVIPNHVIKAAAGGGGGAGGPPINFNISLAGANGDRTIAEIAAAAVKKGLAQVPEINRQHRIRFA